MLKSKGPITDPYGTLLRTSAQFKQYLFKTTLCCLPSKNLLIHDNRFPWIPYPYSLLSKCL